LLEQLGEDGVVMDGLNAVSVGEAVAAAGPDAIVYRLAALPAAHGGKPEPSPPGSSRSMTRFFAAWATQEVVR
jgi:hypothetical protein